MSVNHSNLLATIAAVLLSATSAVTQSQDSTHGVRDFARSDTWLVPAGVTHVIVELWGGGGGGAAAWSAPVSAGPGGGGGGGGSGAYVRTAIAVTPGDTLTISLGEGGAGGEADSRKPAQPGQDGQDTSLLRGDTVLVVARGGRGGALPKRGRFDGGNGGRGGTAEPTDRIVSRPGTDGQAGFRGGLAESDATSGGKGGQAKEPTRFRALREGPLRIRD